MFSVLLAQCFTQVALGKENEHWDRSQRRLRKGAGPNYFANTDGTLTIQCSTVQVSSREHTFLIVFLVRCVQNLENNLVCDTIVKPITALSTWTHVLPGRREHEFKRYPKLEKSWRAIHRKRGRLDDSARRLAEDTDAFLYALMLRFLSQLEKIPLEGPVDRDVVRVLAVEMQSGAEHDCLIDSPMRAAVCGFRHIVYDSINIVLPL